MKTEHNPAVKCREDYQAPDFLITHTDLTFYLKDNQTQVTAQLTIEKQGDHNRDLQLDGEALALKSILIDNQALSTEHYRITKKQLIITNAADKFTLTLVTEIDPVNNTALEGLYKSGAAFCTQCEAEGFRRITYYLDRPDVLSIFTTTIIADKLLFPDLLSNGNLIHSEALDNNLHKAVWHDPFKKPCYLFALVAGDFDCLSDQYTTQSGRDVAIKFYVDKGNLERAHFALASLKKAMKWDEERYGLEYDLDIYMVVAVDFFNMGAMENKGLNVFNSRFVLADPRSATDMDYHNIESVIGHEYFHNWTGNRVTCRDWFQLSLKEGLTVFRDQQFSADMGSAVFNRINAVKVIRSHQFAEDAGPMSHPIRPDKVIEMNNFYTVTVYDKGAEVIRMLHTLLGESGFRAGMDRYFSRHDGQAVTCDDFVDAMADANNYDLKLFKNWYCQAGTPELTVTGHWDQSNASLTLKIKQNVLGHAQALPLHIPIKMQVLHQGGVYTSLQLNDQPFANMLELKAFEDTFVLYGVDKQPSLSLLQDFSAPVKLCVDDTLVNPSQTLAFATDDFARWDAIQDVYTQHILRLYRGEQSARVDDRIIGVLRQLLQNLPNDLTFVAELLQLPPVSTLQEHLDRPNLIELAKAYDLAQKQLAEQLAEDLTSLYQQLRASTARQAESEIGRRALKNSCLRLLGWILPEPELNKLLSEQYDQCDTMTDKLAALSICAQQQLPLFDQLMSDFYEQGKDDSLIADKYLSLVSSWQGDDVFERINAAQQHPQFSQDNPNKVRALYGPFINANYQQFYRPDGKGLALMKDLLISIDKRNPQLASRLITPLLSFARLADEHARPMKQLLEDLQQRSLSNDLYEKVNKAVG